MFPNVFASAPHNHFKNSDVFHEVILSRSLSAEKFEEQYKNFMTFARIIILKHCTMGED